MSDALALKGEAREVALAEAQTVQSMARDETMRERLAELVAAVDDGEVGGEAAELLESVLELGLQTGRIRAYYGPGGEQAALSTLRKLPRGRAAHRNRPGRLGCAAGTRRRADRRSEDHGRRSRCVQPRDRGRRGSGSGAPGRDRCPPDEPRNVSDTRYFMACLDLRGRDCLVVGGGRVATEKVHGLLDCEARVTVVAPHVDDSFAACRCGSSGGSSSASDVVGRLLVIAATDDRAVNAAVSRWRSRTIHALQRRRRP